MGRLTSNETEKRAAPRGLLPAAALIAKTAARALRPWSLRPWPTPSYLIFYLTHRCPLACPACFNPPEGFPPREQARELSLQEIEKIAETFRGLLQVTITGGEPFLRQDAAEAALCFARAGAPSMTIATSGFFPERAAAAAEKLLAESPSLFLDLDISIDGPEQVHDRMRGMEGSFEKAMTAARLAAPLMSRFPGFRVGASVLVSAGNQDAVSPVLEELAGSGLFARIQVLWVRGAPRDPAALDADFQVYEEAARFLDRLSLSRGGGRLKEALSRAVRKTVAETVRRGFIRPCLAGKTMLTVDAFGRVFPCELLPQLKPQAAQESGIPSWLMGNLRETGFELRPVLDSAQARKIRTWIKKEKCFCTFECAAYNNLVFNPLSWPGLAVELFLR